MSELVWTRQMPDTPGIWFFRSHSTDEPRSINVTIDENGDAHFGWREAMRVFDRESPDPQWAKSTGVCGYRGV